MLFVLCYPKFSKADADAIAAFRLQHEPERAAMVAPHVTLVFGVTAVTAAELGTLAANVAKTHAPFEIAVDGFEVGAAERGNQTLALVIGAGREPLIAMHEAFYADALARERREIEFSPHITIATNPRLEAIMTLAPEAKPLKAVRGRIETLDVVRLAERELQAIATFPLDGRA